MTRRLIFFILFMASGFAFSEELDEELAGTLKIEANHNINRLKNLRSEKVNNKIFENEREKGLGEFLEDQEKWDLVRERGLQEYRRQRRVLITPVEGGSEYSLDQAIKRQIDAVYEKSREIHARTRQKIDSQIKFDIGLLEMQELGLDVSLPRYELRKRGLNKWASKSTGSSGTTALSPGFQNNPPPIDYTPPPEFPAAPAPYENYDESQNPPPPIYDGSSGGVPYDPSFGGDMAIPPPPPPPPDYDF